MAAFEAICGPREENWLERQAAVVLVREPANPYDGNAVALYMAGHKVAHLSRGDAAVWAPHLAQLASGGAAVMCKGRIVGGWDRGDGNIGDFGLRLDIVPPQ